MNVFRPSQDLLPSNASVPVLLWIYGGGYLQGESSLFNATEIIVQSVLRVRHTSCLSGCAIVLTGRLQGTPIIYVSVNYRLGPFGFPQGAEAEQLGALNVGLKDQLAGLSWVQKHISAFGGDPTKVCDSTCSS